MAITNIITIEKAVKALCQKKKVTVEGLHGSSYALFMTGLVEHAPQVVCIVAAGKAERYYKDLKRLESETTLIDDTNPFYSKSKIIITKKDILAKKLRTKVKLTLTENQQIDIDDFVNKLQQTGYSREDIVEEENEYASRGGILDFFAPNGEPIRVELYGDRIFSIRKFNTQTQRSVEQINKITLECVQTDISRAFTELIDENAVIITEEELNLSFPTVMITSDGEIQYPFAPAYKYFGDLKRLGEDISNARYTFKFFIQHRTLSEKLKSILGEIEVYPIGLEEGFVDKNRKIIYLTETEIFGEIKKKKRVYRGLFIDDLVGLNDGDYVVHDDYGIGQFKGLTFVDFEHRKVECLRIDYAGEDKVYLPIEKLNLLERYVATRDAPPKLSRLGSEIWLRTKSRIRKATERMAIDLLNLYTRRSQEKGFQFSKDTVEMREIVASFPYEETEDQMNAINEVKNDMESQKPAERLICGDVGYGKTEIALRAAFKAAIDGKQTMILCPTTLLAFQHYNTFRKRLEPFPINVEMVSRFRKGKELKKIIKDITGGKIDVVIGTHRLLQPDIQFKDLGLMIVDEEQRFGVVQKEKIKKLKPGIDIFHLSATPIPRTLYMALTGLRNISNIYTPPAGRKDIITKIIYYNEEEIRKIIQFEIDRKGQVFFVHNRIQTIATIKTKLKKILPKLRICLLHGQMNEEITAKGMIDFLSGKYDLLLSTAIVESGLDMPCVNTMIVDCAHKFGLADLHQLRGRVGRGDIQGYAYFIVPSRRKITDDAHKRLNALVSYTSLGSGFRLALRDMEIRGVGNLLGREQSGHINSVGYHLYIKLLSDAISQLKGEKISYEPILDLKMDAYFPDTYIRNSYERTALYKRFLNVESKFELKSIKDEIIDRFGRYPQEVENLFFLSETRLKARELGATEVIRRGNQFLYYREGKIIKTTFNDKFSKPNVK